MASAGQRKALRAARELQAISKKIAEKGGHVDSVQSPGGESS